jgi:hypothetical protein
VLADAALTDIIKQETLVQNLNDGSVEGFKTAVKLADADLTISLAKAA